MQTFDTVKIGERYLGVKSVCVYGGAPKDPQVSALNQGAEVVIATPGRLLDLHNEGNCPLDMVHTLVLDEADRMLDMGFERDIKVPFPPLHDPHRPSSENFLKTDKP